MNAEEAGNLGGGLLSRANHLDGLLALAGIELGRSTADAAFGPRGLEPRPSPLADHRSLELGKAPDHLHHHATCGGRRIDGLGQTPKAGLGSIDLLQDVQKVLERARQAVELPDHDDVSGAKLIEQPMQLGAVPPATRSPLLEYSGCTGFLESTRLRSGRLLLPLRDSSVAQEVPLRILGLAQTHCERVCQRNTVLQRASP